MKVILYIAISTLSIISFLIIGLWLMYFATGHSIPIKTNVTFTIILAISLILLFLSVKRMRNLKQP